MNKILATTVLIIATLTGHALGQATPAKEAIKNKLNKIVVPSVDLKGASILDITAFMTEKSKALDPAHIGIKVTVDPNVARDIADSRADFSLKNIPMSALLQYVAAPFDISFTITDTGVVFMSKSSAQAVYLTKEYSNISPDFIKKSGNATSAQFKEFFENLGVKFDAVSNIQYSQIKKQLTIKNLEKELDLVDNLVSLYYESKGL